ncbi:MAG: deoxyribodipyrimidine photo-lyase, partial [Microbacteriaceae bacterium]|nr:deoxyribodipyrimidine photo-lyase [Microbacteriaceae bacterium]
MATIFWFRRDLRLNDHPALNQAIELAKQTDSRVFAVVSPLDHEDSANFSPWRRESLWQSWRELNQDLGDRLSVLTDPVAGIIELAKAEGISDVFVSAAFDTKTVEFMKASRAKLESAGLKLHVGPGNYAVAPGRVLKLDGTPFRVYTPFYRAWMALGWEQPHRLSEGANWTRASS